MGGGGEQKDKDPYLGKIGSLNAARRTQEEFGKKRPRRGKVGRHTMNWKWHLFCCKNGSTGDAVKMRKIGGSTVK